VCRPPEYSSAIDQFTVNVTGLLVPPGLLTRTDLAVAAAVVDMAKVAVTVVELTTVTPLMVMPPPVTSITVPAGVKLVPVRVTDTLVPRAPDVGAIDASVGAGGLTTVNVTLLLVPPALVTVTVLAVRAAPGTIVRVALI